MAFIHLSDIHFKDHENYLLEKKEQLLNAIKSTLYDVEKVFVVITGDIAFSGQSGQFDYGLDLINEVHQVIEDTIPNNVEIITIPGNHDCDFSKEDPLRDLVLSQSIESVKDEFIEIACKPLTKYFELEQLFLSDESIRYNDVLFKQLSFQVNSHKIIFNCLNTAWCSKRHEQAAQMFYPIHKYGPFLKESADISITLLHHPTHWLEPNNRREVEAILRQNSDLILSGHEHTSTNTSINDFRSNTTIYFEGGALQTDSLQESSFSIFKVNLSNQNLVKEGYTWNEDYYKKNIEINSSVVQLKKTSKSNQFQITDNFSEWLCDMGIPLKHPRITSAIKLDEFYVFPDAQVINYETRKENEGKNIINLKEILEWKDDKKILLIGNENYGKTSFCKIIFNNAWSKGYIPVYLTGKMLDQTDITTTLKTINREFLKQYVKDDPDQFEQLPKNKVLLIIDDFDSTRLQAKHQSTLLEKLNNVFPNILMTGKEVLKFNHLLSEENNPHLSNYLHLELKAFGHERRGEIIERWIRIGESPTSSESELVKDIDECETVLRKVIGTNFVPSLPFFILTILQSRESKESNLSESAFGYYYEFLIAQSMHRLKIKNDDMDTYYNYLSQLAYFLFTQKETEINRSQMIQFHHDYCNEYDIKVEFGEFEKKMIDAQMLVKSSNIYSFKYKYLYYFFTARYLSKELQTNQEAIKSLIGEMCSKLYIEEYANIVMFLSHLSKHPFILNGVYENAKIILNEFAPSKLEEEIEFLNKMIIEIPVIVMDDKRDVLEQRKERRRALDEVELSKQEITSTNHDISLEEDYEAFDIISKINWATKTLEIMGQILKNYYGSTRADAKLQLGQEAYLLSMRALNSFLITFDENRESIISEIEQILTEKDITSPDRAASTARNFLLNIITALTKFFVKKVSYSLGTMNLEETYQKILINNATNAVRLIDIAIKLDHDDAIPFKDMEDFLKGLKNNSNIFAENILRNLAVDHMYMFPIGYKDRQKLSSLLSINQKKSQTLQINSRQN
ncbi:metallophosphoesterase [Psychrobacillus sp. FJAT-51614]|uniref:Metallophosphoesterase n=1 Tax=Psychrobacillus mangrovi TaxID=3117745 RepID=A0ABU8F822_9BACI